MSNKKGTNEAITLKIVDKNLGDLVEKFENLADRIFKNKKEGPKKENLLS